MEIDSLKSSPSAETTTTITTTEDQMEMMMTAMMLQMDNFPEVYEAYTDSNNGLPYNDDDEFPPADDHDTTATNVFSLDQSSTVNNNTDANASSTPPASFTSIPCSTMSFNIIAQPVKETAPNILPAYSYINSDSVVSSRSQSNKQRNSMAAMRETIFRIAAMQPVHIDPESVKPPKRKNVKISEDPQSVAARHRRERISERIRILQRLVPGGSKMDTASMLDEAIHYVKFLKSQVQYLERASATPPPPPHHHHQTIGFPATLTTTANYLPTGN